MAYSSLTAIFLSFATVSMYYNPMNVAFFEDLERNDRASTTTKDSTVAETSLRPRRALPLDTYVHSLGANSFYAPKKVANVVKLLQ